ncbi:hypothetical protein CC2G_000599 [Coprinopsis cinerea AmutBmut pab1-1]|nr:hypothetical protein CC2G_000599 [Coprinopsis cinerea AmutBmut pab1-1]
MNPAPRKITAKVSSTATVVSSRPPSRTNSPRPPSPVKFSQSSNGSSVVSSAFKPKAKVNSSANVIRRSPSVVSNTPTATPRAGSPTKFTRAQNGTLSPTFTPRVAASNVSRPNGRPQTPVSAPGTPETRTRSLAGGSEVGRPSPMRPREGSGSQLHHAVSFSSLKQATTPNTSPTQSLRIRSKVSNISKTAENSPLSPTAAPGPPLRLRSPSSASNLSSTTNAPPQQFYPITTAVPAANPHRYGQMRPSPPHHAYTPPVSSAASDLQPNTSPKPSRPRFNSTARVDFNAANVISPPVPASPPISAVSFSSRSSISVASTSRTDDRRDSGATELPPSMGTGSPQHQRHGSSASVNLSDDQPQSPEVDEHHQVRAEAKSNRKIADLEISNRSLLTINASLEATKNRQAKEIRDLRRKLRESRLVLPPGAYRMAKSSWSAEEQQEEEDDSDDSELEDVTQGNGDEIYKRVKAMIEGLLTSGRAALEKKVEDFAEPSAKVLTAEEVQSWHRSNKLGDETDDHSDLDSVSQGDMSFTSTNYDDDDDHDDDPSDNDSPFFNTNIFNNSNAPPIRISEVD